MEIRCHANHKRFVPVFHGVLFGLIVLTSIGSLVNLFAPKGNHRPLSRQRRGVRAAENLRHFVLTGKMFEPKLTLRRIAGLRFASDAEFARLAQSTIQENVSGNQIKKFVKGWRPAGHRV